MTLADSRLVSADPLDDVAAEAGVSVQTLLRHFGSRAGLVEAVRRARRSSRRRRGARTPVGDVDAAVRVVLDHYELRGDGVLLMLARSTTTQRPAR